jgi:uncharacterized MAPEG superfamily protein
MTVAYWCVFAAILLPYSLALAHRWPGAGYGLSANRAPRLYEERLSGWRRRAHWAHLNGLEMFAPFAAAVLIADHLGARQATLDAWALAFVAFRVAHAIFYLADLGVPRTLAFFGSFACVIGLFLTAA